MTWFNQAPEICDGIMLIGHYDAEIDDTEFYEVWKYPSLEYIGNVSASRFGSKPIKRESFTDNKHYTVCRDVMPFEGKENMWLERIHYGYLSFSGLDRREPLAYSVYRIVDKVKTFKEIQIEFPSILIDNENNIQWISCRIL